MTDLAFSAGLLATLKEHREWSGPSEYIRDCLPEEVVGEDRQIRINERGLSSLT
jgi:hypothetical protein